MMRLVGDFVLTVRFIRRGIPLWVPRLYVTATPPMEWAGTETSCPYRFPRLSRGGGQGVVWAFDPPIGSHPPPGPLLGSGGGTHGGALLR
jgi:hypothetical protein